MQPWWGLSSQWAASCLCGITKHACKPCLVHVGLQSRHAQRLHNHCADWFNYGAAISKDISYWPYIAGSILGQAPHNAVNILIGSSVRNASSLCGG